MHVQQTVMKISGKGQVVIVEARPTQLILKKKAAESIVEKYAGSMKGKIPSIKRYLEMKKEELKLEE